MSVPEPVKKINQVMDLLSRVNDDNYEFNNRRAIQLSEEYEVTDLLNKELYVYTQALAYSNLQKYSKAIYFFERVPHEILRKYGDSLYIQYWSNFASIYYIQGNFIEALTKIKNIENMLIKSDDFIHIVEAFILYIESGEYEKGSFFAEKVLNNKHKIPKNIYDQFAIYYLFYLSEIGNYNKLVLNLIHLIPYIEQLEECLTYIRKPYLTDMENKNVSNLREIIKLINNYSLDEIFFKEKIIFNNYEFVVDFERYPKWFYGEIKEVENCRAAGLTIEELKENLALTLKVCLDKNNSSLNDLNIPSKIILKKIMELKLNRNLEEELQEQNTIDLNDLLIKDNIKLLNEKELFNFLSKNSFLIYSIYNLLNSIQLLIKNTTFSMKLEKDFETEEEYLFITYCYEKGLETSYILEKIDNYFAEFPSYIRDLIILDRKFMPNLAQSLG